jgi:choline kinase
MTNAIILSAGQGKRLLPLTETRPKCMLTVAGKTILEWQVQTLLAAEIGRIFIITGFNSDLVEEHVNDRFGADMDRINIIFNPFYSVSDNLASCWMGRHAMDEDFLLLNGDTLFEPALLDSVLASPQAPVTLTIDFKDSYDNDDMRVELQDSMVISVGKTLPDEHTMAESIGLLYFRGEGPALFRDHLDRQMKRGDGLRLWFLSVVDALAKQSLVRACSISGRRWCEIDFKRDLEKAESIVLP